MSTVLRGIVAQHLEEAAGLHRRRAAFTAGPSRTLPDLARYDERLAAHLDGLAVAGDDAWPLCVAALARAVPGVVFVAAVTAVQAKSSARLDELFHARLKRISLEDDSTIASMVRNALRKVYGKRLNA